MKGGRGARDTSDEDRLGDTGSGASRHTNQYIQPDIGIHESRTVEGGRLQALSMVFSNRFSVEILSELNMLTFRAVLKSVTQMK